MKCPEYRSQHIRKNGKNKGKQNYICVACRRQLITDYKAHKGYSDEFKREGLKLYVNGMGLRAIERVKGVHHTTVITGVKQIGELLPDTYDLETTPQVGELNELETLVGIKKTNLAVDGSRSLGSRNCRLVSRRPESRSFSTLREFGMPMAMLFLCH